MRRSTVISLALAACLAAVVSVRLTAEPTKIKVDGKIIKSYIAYLSLDEQQGRRTLTPGYEKMAEWAAGKFKEWGLKPAGEKRRDYVVFARSYEYFTYPRLKVNSLYLDYLREYCKARAAMSIRDA